LRALCIQVSQLLVFDCIQVRTATAFEQLLDATAEVGARLLVDLSDHLDLSSLPGANGVLEFMASKPLPAHATIFCSLVKNQVTITRQRESRSAKSSLQQLECI
jgi:hypothetical protein